MTEHNLLYEACTNALVSDRCGTETWEKVAKFVTEQQQEGCTYEHIKEQFVVVEKQIKADFKITKLPAAWRSAKSTALAACQAGVAMVVGEVVSGKTAVSKATRVPKNKDVNSLTTVSKYLAFASAYLPLVLSDADRISLLGMVGSLRGQIEGIPDA